MHVFISYKREEESFARRLHDAVESWGFEPWLDVLDIQQGEEWDHAIHAGIRAAEIVIGVLTPASLTSKNVLDEWGYALSTDKRLFLLWLQNVPELDIPPRYIRIQRIDCRRNLDDGIAILQRALQSAAKVVPVAVPAGVADTLNITPNSVITEDVLQPTTTEPIVPVNEALSLQTRTNRERMLEKVRIFWVNGVLEQSVHGAALIELGLQSQQSSVENPWDTVFQNTDYGDYRLPTGTKIGAVYKDLNGALLILGDPGSGKTTTLIELCRDMIEVAENEDTEPIPVVFNLSSWADERKPLADWLQDELVTKYQVPLKVAQDWLGANALLLLLDGLDEVDSRYRDDCVNIINDFRSEYDLTRLVVCSRIADYESLTNRLNLNGAIVLQPLDDTQVDRYLATLGTEMQGVRTAMSADSSLRKLGDSPLMLSIMTIAFRGLTAADLPQLDTVEAQRKRLFESYTKRMFERRKNPWYSPEKTLHYLKWLARRMVERKQSVFYIENLQLDWLPTLLQRYQFRLLNRLLFGLSIGAIVGSITFIVAGLLFLVSKDLFKKAPINILTYTLFGALIGSFIGGFLFGLTGLISATIGNMLSPDVPRMARLRFALINILNSALIGGFFGLIVTRIINLEKSSAELYFYTPLVGWSYGFINVQFNLVLHGIIFGISAAVLADLLTGFLSLTSIRSQRVIYTIYGLIGGTFFTFFLLGPSILKSGFTVIVPTLIGGFVLFLFAGQTDTVQSVETLGWRWNWRWAMVGFALGIAVGLIERLSSSSFYNPTTRLIQTSLIIGLPAMLIGGVASGVRKRQQLEMRISPNEGILRTFRSALVVMLIFGVGGAFIGAGLYLLKGVLQPSSTIIDAISFATSYNRTIFIQYFVAGLGIGLAVGLILGGLDSVIKHYLLRLFLQRAGSIPRNYARLLDYAADRILLRKVGGGYIFIHRYLLEYFASLETKSDNPYTNLERRSRVK